MTHRPELHLVTIAMPDAAPPRRPEHGDLALTAAILLVAVLPLALHLAGLGHWSGGALGLGAALATFAALQLLDRARQGRARAVRDGRAAARAADARGGSLRAG